jgi:hypothetical protein
MNKLFFSILSLFFLLLIISNLSLAQTSTIVTTATDKDTTLAENLATTTATDVLNSDDFQSFVNSLEAPKIIKNNVRVSNVNNS